MPTFPFLCPPFLRSRRSRSPKPSREGRHDSPGFATDLALSPPNLTAGPSSILGFPEQNVNATADTPRTSGPEYPADFPTSPGRHYANRKLDDLGGQSARKLQSVHFAESRIAQLPGPHDVAAEQPAQLPYHFNFTHPTHSQQSPVSLHSQTSLMRVSHDPSNSQPPIQPSGQYSPQVPYQGQGMFNRAHDFTVTGTFIDGNVNIATSSLFMEKFLEQTIPGATVDSSARYPPPRCHPGTRLVIVRRCLDFISGCHGAKKVRWVVGAAGVGKSAIMQSVAESPLLVTPHASVFFSVNGRNDGSKAIITISYQLAATLESYRQLIECEIARDPSLLQSSMPMQFHKFIVEPFILNPSLNSAGRVLIIIDGLDECKNPHAQLELLRLISDLCIRYPSSPLVWLIASRPEAHISSFFSRTKIEPIYEKEEILVHSENARGDVERFLRDKLMEIKETMRFLNARSDWPEEQDIIKLCNASSGLFAYAQAIIRYVGDLTVGSPVSQLADVLNAIDNHPMTGVSPEEHPMVLLDALYAQILSNVPTKIMINTRKLLLAMASNWSFYSSSGQDNFMVLCNWLAMTPDEAYAAINHLHSVLHVPLRDKAHKERLESFHKSFIDYISDTARSGVFPDIRREAQQFKTQCAFRILKEVASSADVGIVNHGLQYRNATQRNPSTGNNISLTWPVDEGADWDDSETKSAMHKLAISEVVVGMGRGDLTFQSRFCVRSLTTWFRGHDLFPYANLCESVFDESRRHELMSQGVLKKVPLKAINISDVVLNVNFRLRRRVTTAAHLSSVWNLSCNHKREGEWEEGKSQDWTTMFWWYECTFCSGRLERQFTSWKTQSPDHTVPILFTSTGHCCVEFQFVDPEDDMSMWTYWFWYELSLEERKKYGSTV